MLSFGIGILSGIPFAVWASKMGIVDDPKSYFIGSACVLWAMIGGAFAAILFS